MDSPGSLQGEREFHNELNLCSNLKSPFVISLLGFSSDRRGRKLVLVYELMPNRSLQDALLDRRCPELMDWGKRAVEYSDASPVGGDKLSVVSDGCFESVDSGNVRKKGGGGGGSGRDWWWRQESGGGGESGRVKDYVMEWIGSEIKKERPKSEKPREWWKEEFCEELCKKSRKKKRGMEWWQREEDGVEQKRKRKSKGSRGSIDWWLDGLSGESEIKNNGGRRNSQDWVSGDVPKSGGISSTPSMRGTVCYIAPEYGGGGQLSEKCDVYSFGVLLLVLVAGRRPLQVTASPISEFERANLISWARQLAHNGRLLDLVDTSIHSLDKEQALLCITIALLCLQRCPGKRPSMKEVVGMLNGEAEPPHLPFEFSPSPPSNFPFKSRKKAR
uniref:Receptor-like protein kinase HAIKU2 n=1 Tax=Cajanus cajan TaxID=3821 RepID=A0A151UCE8_CAJCA|nr:Receptor-like protein kinase HAIKU2 [Cajanus cajan]